MPFPAHEVILSDEAEAALGALRSRTTKTAASIVRRVHHLRRRLLADIHTGELVPTPLPKSARRLEQRHGTIHRLRCCDLPDGWRLLYSLYNVDQKRYVYILEVVDHSQYSKWFPGRRKLGRTKA